MDAPETSRCLTAQRCTRYRGRSQSFNYSLPALQLYLFEIFSFVSTRPLRVEAASMVFALLLSTSLGNKIKSLFMPAKRKAQQGARRPAGREVGKLVIASTLRYYLRTVLRTE